MIQWKGWSPRQRQGPEENQLDSWKPQDDHGNSESQGPSQRQRDSRNNDHMQKCPEMPWKQPKPVYYVETTVWNNLNFNLAWKLFETYWNLLKQPFETIWNRLNFIILHGSDAATWMQQWIHTGQNLWAFCLSAWTFFLKNCLCCSAAMEGKKRWTWTGNY